MKHPYVQFGVLDYSLVTKEVSTTLYDWHVKRDAGMHGFNDQADFINPT